MPAPITIAIMAGGASTRMGTDKTALRIGGLTFLEHIATEALAMGLPVLVVGRDKPETWEHDEVSFIGDGEPGQGPIGGLVTALRFVTDSAILAVAADMPLVTRATLDWLIAKATRKPYGDGLIVLNNGYFEPLFSVYGHRSLAPAELAIATHVFSLKRLIRNGNYREVDASPEISSALVNVNTQEEYARLCRS